MASKSVSQEGNLSNVNSEGLQILIEACTHLRTAVRDLRDKIAKFEATCVSNVSSTSLVSECDRLINVGLLLNRSLSIVVTPNMRLAAHRHHVEKYPI
jgi:hypothetical protein